LNVQVLNEISLFNDNLTHFYVLNFNINNHVTLLLLLLILLLILFGFVEDFYVIILSYFLIYIIN
jgi:hypothetical protein